MGEEDKKATSDPLYGAPAPSTSLPQAPPAPAVQGEVKPAPITTEPLYGATPTSSSSTPPSTTLDRNSPPSIPRRNARLPLHHPSPLPAYLRKLGYILSLVLGSSAVIAGIWSIFILPLLHSSFSARKALVEQQKDRWTTLLDGIRRVKAGRLYESASTSTPPTASEGEKEESSSSETDEAARLIDHDDSPPPEGLIPLSPISSLSTTLANLVSALMSTSTTRTSLLSTLESYTSTLHRQVYIRSQPLSAQRYGLGTLSANLAKAGGGRSKVWPYDDGNSAGGGDGDLDGVGVKSEEWDAVRKEVRAIKGMLLSRRNFAPVEAAGK